VHRGAESTYDESADLAALAKHPVAVVSAGAKAVLDLPRTVERLETLGVPVVGYGTDDFPAFYAASSGLRLAARFDDVATLAKVALVHLDRLGGGGVLIVQPPPSAHAMPIEAVDGLIDDAIAAAERAGIRGAGVTPFLLRALDDSTDGAVVETNVALVEANARLAARISAAAVTAIFPSSTD
jgi:pseudouridine-5'-phosphate glycosidase